MTTHRNFRLNPICSALLAMFTATALHANPRNPAVVAGQASFTTQGKTFTVKNSPGAIINWQQFSIGTGETTRFVQQNAASSVLNRVTGQDPSKILGTLQSNGRVFIVNPNGIVFGQGSKIDVASLVASSLNIGDADFRAGKYRFEATGGTAGNIQNLGTLNAGSKGNIYLIAPEIENSGIINAPNGQVLLAAGRTVQLVDIGNPHLRIEVSAPTDKATNLGSILARGGEIGLYGASLVNRGSISADSAIIGPGGKIVFKASGGNITLDEGSRLSASGATGGSIVVQADATQSGDTLVHGASLTATGSAGKGGSIDLLGQRVGVDGATTADASGSAGGGTILIGGDYQGGNAAVQNAARTYVGSDVRLKADATAKGDGGRIIVWSDEVTRAYGSESVRGGPQGGNGGLVELSGKQQLDFRPTVDLAAPKGKAGTLLLDPLAIEIYGSANATASSGVLVPPSGNSTINFADAGTTTVVKEDELEGFTSGTIVLHAQNSVAMMGTAGDFQNNVVADGGNKLRLQPGVNLDIATAGGTGDITLKLVPIVAQNGNVTISASGSSGILTAAAIDAGTGQIALTGNEARLSGTFTSSSSINVTATGPLGILPDPAATVPYTLNNTSSTAGTITLEADRVQFLGIYGGYVNMAGTNAVLWIKPRSAGTQIRLGTDSSTLDANLNIGTNDLSRFTPAGSASTLKIGSATAGNAILTGNFHMMDPEFATLHLISGGNIDNGGGSYDIQGFNATPLTNFVAQAGGDVDLFNTGNLVTNLSGSAGGKYRFRQNANLAVAAAGITAGTFFELQSAGGAGITLNGVAAGSASTSWESVLEATAGSITQSATGGVAAGKLATRAGNGWVLLDVTPANNNVGEISGHAYTTNDFRLSQSAGFTANNIGTGPLTPDRIFLTSSTGNIVADNLKAGGRIDLAGKNLTVGNLTLTTAGPTNDILLLATTGTLNLNAGASIVSTTGGKVKLKAATNVTLGAGSTVDALTGNGTVDLVAGAAIQGNSALVKGNKVFAVADSGIDLKTQDIVQLSAKNTGSGQLFVRDTASDPANPSPPELEIKKNTNADGTVLNGLENGGGDVIVKSDRQIRVSGAQGTVLVSSPTRIELESQHSVPSNSYVRVDAQANPANLSAAEVVLRANNLGFLAATYSPTITGTGATGFVKLSAATSGGIVEVHGGTPVGGAALAIDKTLFGFITSPYIGIGSDDSFVPGGGVLISTPLTAGSFNAGFAGLGLMATTGTISQTAGATLALPSLITTGGASVNLMENNAVGKLAAKHTGSATFNFKNSQNLDIGRIAPLIGPVFEGVTTDGGNITINVAGNLTASDASTGSRKEIDAGAGDVTLTSTGNMALRRVEGNRIQMNAGGNIIGFIGGAPAALKADVLVATAGGSIGMLLDTNVNKLNASTSAATANIDITEANDVGIGVINSAGNVRILAAGNILDENGIGTLNVTARQLDAKGNSVSLDTRILDSARIEGTGTNNTNVVRLNDIAPQTALATPLQVTAISAGNPIDITAQRSLRVDASGPAGGNIRVATTNTAGQPNSDIHTGLIQTVGGTLQMTAGGAIIDDNDTAAAGAMLNIDAANLDMKAETGIGADNPLEIKVSKLAVENKSGTVALANTGNLEITKADIGLTGTSDLKIATDGTLTVSGPVSTTSGSIDLVATGDIQQNANISTGSAGSILVKSTTGALRMAPGTATTSNGGTIDCDANGDVILSQLSTGSTGSVTVRTKTGSIGSSSTGNNITTGSMLLAAAKGISGIGFTSKTADVSSASGFVTITDTSAGTVISNDPAINPPEEILEEENAVEQAISESILASINTITPTAGENPNQFPESNTTKKEDEEAKKANKEGNKDGKDGTTKKAGLPVCGK